MRTAFISWTDFEFGGETGTVNGLCMFMIDIKGKRNPKYVLKSWPIVNECFTRANNSKILFESEDLNLVKQEAQKSLEKYVRLFTEPGMDKNTELYLEERMHKASSKLSRIAYAIVYSFLEKH